MESLSPRLNSNATLIKDLIDRKSYGNQKSSYWSHSVWDKQNKTPIEWVIHWTANYRSDLLIKLKFNQNLINFWRFLW